MPDLENELKRLALEHGADLAGITTRPVLADGPPSADPSYVLPSARSVVAFAVALDPPTVRAFISKEDWLSHCRERKEKVQRLYTIGDRLAAFLRERGHEALNVDVNNNYRPEPGAADVTEMTEFHPAFAHRYAALGAGLGRLGWSGNLMTPRYGSLVELGSVVTSADLAADPVLAEHPCDRCKMCALSCPVGMIDPKESITVTVAGVTETIARKRPNTCCWIGCTGYEGLSRSGDWGNWSPYRLGRPLPEDRDELDTLCISLQKADPMMNLADNSFTDYRAAAFDPDWFYYTVCGFCRSVCWPDRRDRLENHKLITGSGTAALRLDGMHVPADDKAVEEPTPFLVDVVVEPGEAAADPPAYNPMDREVIVRRRARGL
jgi:epoxyqueuosine reductase